MRASFFSLKMPSNKDADILGSQFLQNKNKMEAMELNEAILSALGSPAGSTKGVSLLPVTQCPGSFAMSRFFRKSLLLVICSLVWAMDVALLQTTCNSNPPWL